MIEWPTIKTVLTGLVADLSDLGPTAVRWMDEPERSTWGPGTTVYLRASSIASQGDEEELRETVGDFLSTVVVCGQRRFTLSISCESFTQDIADTNFAGNVIERIAIRLYRSTSHARYAGLFAIESRMPIKWVSYKSGERQMSSYVLDLLLRTVDNDTDTTVNAGTWINEAVIDGLTVDNAAGPLSPQPHIDVVGDA
jgi:hypothetical protein